MVGEQPTITSHWPAQKNECILAMPQVILLLPLPFLPLYLGLFRPQLTSYRYIKAQIFSLEHGLVFI